MISKGKAQYQQTMVSPETIKLKTPYTFTISPDDQNQYWNSNIRDLKQYSEYNNLIHSWNKEKYEILLHQEVSRNGRLHFHGIIKFNTNDGIHDFYVNRLFKLQQHNQVEIDSIKDIEVWILYINKYKHIYDKIIDNQKEIKSKTCFTTET